MADAERQEITGRAFLANAGEVFAWLSDTPEAARLFSQWYNRTVREVGASSRPPVTPDQVLAHACGMELLCGTLLAELISRPNGGMLPL